jgi:hypothetical protein
MKTPTTNSQDSAFALPFCLLTLLAVLLPSPSWASLTGNLLTPSAITTSQWTIGGDGSKENMINGSGLSGAGSVETRLHDASGSAATMWHAGGNSGGISGGATGFPPLVASQAVEFDLGANFDLTGAHVWNMNQAGNTGRGIRGVEIFISPDAAGATWTSVGVREFTEATGLAGLAAQDVSFTGTNARRVRFQIQSAWSGAVSEYVGLSEVRFRGNKAPITISGTNLGPIPDNDPSGRDVLFTVAGTTGLVETVSVQITFNPAHTRMDNLRIQLFAPTGASAVLFESSFSRTPDLAGPYTFTDAAVSTLYSAAWNFPQVMPSGNFWQG